MPLYQYKAYTENGKHQIDTQEARSEEELRSVLASAGIMPYSISPYRSKTNLISKNTSKKPPQKLSASELSGFFSGLAVLLTSKFTLDSSLKLIQKIEPDKKMRAAYQKIQEQTSSGQPFSSSLTTTLDLPPHVLAIFKSSEAEGSLSGAMERVSQEFKERSEFRKQLSQSLAYPIFLVCLLFVVICLLSLQLVPALLPIFAGNDDKMPFMIRFLSGMNEFFLQHQLVIGAGLLALLIVLLLPMTRHAVIQYFAKSLRRLPFFGSTFKRMAAAQYLKTLGTLIESKVPVTQSLDLAAMGMPLEGDRKRLKQVARNVVEGGTIHAALNDANFLEDYIISMISMGEESDNLAQMVKQSAQLEADKAQRSVSNFLAILSPALTILIGLSVGGVVISVMTALLSLNDIVLQ